MIGAMKSLLNLLPGFVSACCLGSMPAVELQLPDMNDSPRQNAFGDMEVSMSEACFRNGKIPGGLVCLRYDLSRLKDGNDSGIRPDKAGEAALNKLTKRFTEKGKLSVWGSFHRVVPAPGDHGSSQCYLLRGKTATTEAAAFVPISHLLQGFVYAPRTGRIRFCGLAGGRLLVYLNRKLVLDTGWRRSGLQMGERLTLSEEKASLLTVLLLELDAEASGGILLVEYSDEKEASDRLHLFRTDFTEPDETVIRRWREWSKAPIGSASEAPVWLLPQHR